MSRVGKPITAKDFIVLGDSEEKECSCEGSKEETDEDRKN